MRSRSASAEKPPNTTECGGADSCARQHRHRKLRDHGHVDRHAVATLDAETAQCVRAPADLLEEIRVGDGASIPGLALEVEGDPVAARRPRRDGRGNCRRRSTGRRRTTWRRAAASPAPVPTARTKSALSPARPRIPPDRLQPARTASGRERLPNGRNPPAAETSGARRGSPRSQRSARRLHVRSRRSCPLRHRGPRPGPPAYRLGGRARQWAARPTLTTCDRDGCNNGGQMADEASLHPGYASVACLAVPVGSRCDRGERPLPRRAKGRAPPSRPP